MTRPPGRQHRDQGVAGRDFGDLVITGFAVRPVQPDRRDEAPRRRSIGWIHQWIESVNDTLIVLSRPRPRVP